MNREKKGNEGVEYREERTSGNRIGKDKIWIPRREKRNAGGGEKKNEIAKEDERGKGGGEERGKVHEEGAR